MKIVPYEKEHLETVLPTELETVETTLGVSAKEFMEITGENSIAMTALNDRDEVVLIAGVHPMWPGVYEIWMHTTPTFYTHKLTAIKALKILMRQLTMSIGYKRVQADIRADLVKNINFVKLFGFHFEGQMLKYGFNGETYLRFALYGE